MQWKYREPKHRETNKWWQVIHVSFQTSTVTRRSSFSSTTLLRLLPSPTVTGLVSLLSRNARIMSATRKLSPAPQGRTSVIDRTGARRLSIGWCEMPPKLPPIGRPPILSDVSECGSECSLACRIRRKVAASKRISGTECVSAPVWPIVLCAAMNRWMTVSVDNVCSDSSSSLRIRNSTPCERTN